MEFRTKSGIKCQMDEDDVYRFGYLNWLKTSRGCLRARIGNKNYFLHRVIMAAQPDQIVDHINGILLDNRKANLRFVTSSQSNINKANHGKNTSGVTGVYWVKKTNEWNASISVNQRLKHLGNFKHFEDAVACRKAAEKKFYGEYVREI